MKAAVVGDKGFGITEIDEPKPEPNEVLIRVRACGLNRADIMVAGGMSHGRQGGPGTVIGIEYAGEVIEVGSDTQGVRPGDRVMCSGSAGWAEYAVSDWGRLSTIPGNNMNWAQAATLPVALQTMHNAVITAGRMTAGEAVMIQGASSGVGLMGMQIAREMGAKLVVGSSTNAERRARLCEFGADLAVDSTDEAWVQQVLDATDGKGVDLIVDQISGYAANQNLAATAILGRIVNVGRLGGFTGEFDFDLHALRRIDYIGVSFRSRSIEEIRVVVNRMRVDLWDMVEAGKLSLPIDSEYSLDDAPEAVEHMRTNNHFGKIILNVGD
jgi:NADPH:quinone reductase